MKRLSFIAFAALASVLFAAPAMAKKVTIHVKNCSARGAKICIYHGNDKERTVAKKHKIVEKNGRISVHCDGQNKGRCFIAVVSRGKGCGSKEYELAIKRNKTANVKRVGPNKWKAYKHNCPR